MKEGADESSVLLPSDLFTLSLSWVLFITNTAQLDYSVLTHQY